MAAGRRGGGCFAGGCLRIIFGFLIIGGGVVLLLDAVLAPWTYYYGGHLHFPGWQGQGWIHSNSAGGDYWLWLRINPSTPAWRKSDIQGIGYLCTPKGERFRLTLYGDLPRPRPANTLGVPLHLSMHRSLLWTLSNDDRPQLKFYGSFGNSELNLEDRGSLASAFRPDGTLYSPKDRTRPTTRQHEVLPFTLKESTPWTLGPPCPAKTH